MVSCRATIATEAGVKVNVVRSCKTCGSVNICEEKPLEEGLPSSWSETLTSSAALNDSFVYLSRTNSIC